LDNLIDLLDRIFKYIPSERITAKDAMNHPFFKDVKESLMNEKSTVKKIK